MRWLFGLLLMLVGLTLATPLLQKLQSRVGDLQPAANKPAAAKSTSIRPPTATRGATADDGTSAQTGTSTISLYRWVDANGTIHYEMSPPPEGNAEELTMRTDLPGGSEPVGGAAPALPSGNAGALSNNPLNVYTPAGQDELMQRLDQTLERLGDRQKLMKDLKEDL